jgi:hypothetical protein
LNPAIENLRRALCDLALPAEAQLALFPAKNQAVAGLSNLLDQAHNQADVSRSELLSLGVRQAIDELLWDLNSPILGTDAEGKIWDIGHKDDFLRESDVWVDIRLRAKAALTLLDTALRPRG